MPPLRRNVDRRRRVLYQAHAAPHAPQSPRRRDTEALRAARQPAKVFGSRVRQPLRGRWFSLVPVSTFSLSLLVGTLAFVPLLLTALHYLAITWPTLAYRDAIARPFRIDFSDSFAAWWLTAVMLLSTGTSLLIYQLRRHRSDDYRGHYRLWRLTMCVMFVACINSTVGLLSWFGAVVDLVVGDRAALSGERWLRILVDVAGIILTMRLAAEVYRCRAALISLLAGAALVGYAEAAVWNLITIDNAAKSTLVIAAPLLGFSSFLISSTSYLRLLYRQARNIDDAAPLRQRLKDWAAQTFARDDEPIAELEEIEFARPNAVAVMHQDETAPSRKAKSNRSKATPSQTQPTPEPESAEPKSEAEEPSAKPKRGWFGRRKPAQDSEPDSAEEKSSSSDKPKKGLFSMRLRPKASPAEDPTAVDDGDAQSKEKPKRGLGGFLRRKDSSGETESAPEPASSSTKHQRSAPQPAAKTQTEQADDEADADDIDWDSMSKSERRRLRKKLRRGGHAA